MAYDVAGFKFSTLLANADMILDASQFLFVKQRTDNGKIEGSGSGENALGVLQNKPAANRAAVLMASGISKVNKFFFKDFPP